MNEQIYILISHTSSNSSLFKSYDCVKLNADSLLKAWSILMMMLFIEKAKQKDFAWRDPHFGRLHAS